MRGLLLIIAVMAIILFMFSCGKDYKTPADVKGTVAWLNAESALPVFPFGTNPIYFYFHTDQSPYCRAMKEKIFSRPEIIKYMNEHFTTIIIIPDSLDTVTFYGETMTTRELLAMLQVEGLPSHYFFNRMGELKGARTGYIQLKEFKQLLKYVAEGYIEKQDFNSYLESNAADLDTVWGKF